MERKAGNIVLPAVFHERLKRSARTAKEDLEHENDLPPSTRPAPTDFGLSGPRCRPSRAEAGFRHRNRLDIARDDRNADLILYFLAVDGEGWVYWNGQMIKHHVGWNEPFLVRIPNDSILHDKPNVLAVRVYDGKADGGMTGAVLKVEQRR